jgi:hypothetical protein
MQIVVCPGMHSPELTAMFWDALQRSEYWQTHGDRLPAPFIYPDAPGWAFSAFHIHTWLVPQVIPNEPILIVAFSAGVVGAIGVAWMLQSQGMPIQALIAIDGWGVPLVGTFPIYRLSHDRFTHDTSGWLGGIPIFYAEPSVLHLDMWRSPDQVRGQWRQNTTWTGATLAEVVIALLLAAEDDTMDSRCV